MQNDATMVLSADVTAADIFRMADEFPGWQIERLAGKIVMSPPAGSNTGRRNSRLNFILASFARTCGFDSFDSSTGWTLPNGDILSPDGSLVRTERFAALDEAERETFARLVPDVVVELVSPSDRDRKGPREKCDLWFEQGVRYVVLIDPFAKTIASWGTAPRDFPDLRVMLELDLPGPDSESGRNTDCETSV